jgi:hypothetical protein
VLQVKVRKDLLGGGVAVGGAREEKRYGVGLRRVKRINNNKRRAIARLIALTYVRLAIAWN